jgi:transmembrane 9 superfamily protein 2/4
VPSVSRLLHNAGVATTALEMHDISAANALTGRNWSRLAPLVFRPPLFGTLLAGLVGLGAQSITSALLLLALGASGVLFINQEPDFLIAALVIFVLCYIVGGFAAGFAARATRKHLGVAFVTAAYVLPAPTLAAALYAATNAIYRHEGATTALPIGAAAAVYGLWVAVGTGLAVPGIALMLNHVQPYLSPIALAAAKRAGMEGDRGHDNDNDDDAGPAGIAIVPDASVIPGARSRPPWWHHPLRAVVGLGEFALVVAVVSYMLDAMWSPRVYGMFGAALLTFVLYWWVVACATILLVYVQLSAGYPYWWWSSFHAGAASAVAAGVWMSLYYFWRTPIAGLASSFIFAAAGLVCIAAAAALHGTVGFFAAYFFLHVGIDWGKAD